MTASPGRKSAAERYAAAAIARHRAETMIAGTGLTIRERASELVITNPGDPDTGEIHISYDTGYVSWVRPAWEHWGCLTGYHDPETETPGHVSATQILRALTTPAP